MARRATGRGARDARPARGGRARGRRRGARGWLTALGVLTLLAGGGALAAAWMGLVPGVRLRARATPDEGRTPVAVRDAPPPPDSVALAAGDSALGDSVYAEALEADEALPVPAADSGAGDALFRGAGRCAGCHGAAGEGVDGLGPNLRDDEWLHGGSRREIRRVIAEGASPARGGFTVMMPAYGGQLGPAEQAQLAAYVWTLSRPGSVLPDTALLPPPPAP